MKYECNIIFHSCGQGSIPPLLKLQYYTLCLRCSCYYTINYTYMYKGYTKRFLFCNVISEHPGKPNNMLIR